MKEMVRRRLSVACDTWRPTPGGVCSSILPAAFKKKGVVISHGSSSSSSAGWHWSSATLGCQKSPRTALGGGGIGGSGVADRVDGSDGVARAAGGGSAGV